MPERPDEMLVPVGAFRALGWFFEASKDAFLALYGQTIRRANPAWTAITGFEATASEGGTLWDFISPADQDEVRGKFERLNQGERFVCELRLRTRDGPDLWARADFAGGEAPWVLAILRDITAERRLRESEVRFRGLVNATSDVVYRMSPDWLEMRQLDGRGFIADTETPSVAWIDQYLLPEDQPQILAAIEEAIARKGVFQLEHRVRQLDGTIGWTFSRALPIQDEAGEIIEWFGAATDVTERHRAEEHLQLVVHELNHRVKNNLATMLAVTSQTFRNARDMQDAEASVTARLEALAHASDLLTGDAWAGPSLRGVVEQAVRPHCVDDARCLIEGPEIELSPRKAHTLSLAIHELATNAVKHGAWSAQNGQVVVTWSAEGATSDRRLHLEWRERGGPQVAPPAKRGFGSRLIERVLAGELGGGVKLQFEPTGLVCVVDARLAA
jgi:PAS domain S-box-containing protein